MIWLLALACAYKVDLESLPPGALVQLPDDRGTVVTPSTVPLRWAPFKSQEVTVSAPGYTPLTVDLRNDEIRFSRYFSDFFWRSRTLSGASRGSVTFVLVPVHGPSGTWGPEEVE